MRVAVLVLVLVAGAVASAQEPVVVRGRVTAADTGLPLANAIVAMQPPIGRRAIRTNADGTFEIPVTESRLTLTITKPGYQRTAVSRPRVPGQMNVSLARAGVLTVYVVNAAGDPVPGASVWTLCGTGNGGGGGGESSADDLGRRRVSSLAAGECLVDAAPSLTSQVGLPASFGTPDALLEQAARLRSALGGLQPGVDVASNPASAITQRMAEHRRNAVKVTIRAGEESTITVQPSVLAGTVVANSVGATGTGSIRGRVVATGNRPVPNATVLASSGDSRHLTVTDQNGAYELSRLPAGTFALSVRAPGFVGVDSSGTAPLSRQVPLDAGQQAVADFNAVKGGVITGTVLDEYGEPAEGVMVSAQPTVGLPPMGASALQVLPTDDRGQYRIAGLPSGSYRVLARIGRDGSDDMLFYPGRPSLAEAVPVAVVVESETPGIDFGVTSPLANALRGQVTMSSGALPAGAVARLVERRAGSASAQPRTASVGPAGNFSFPEVPAGTYELSVTAGASYVIVTRRSGQAVQASPPPPTEFSHMDVTVSGSSMAPIAVTTFPGSRVRGHLTFEGDRGTAVPSAFRLAAPADQSATILALLDQASTAVPDANWAFDLQDLSTATRIGLVQAPRGWYLKTLMIGGINAADDPVDFSRGAHSSNDVRAVIAKTSTITGRVSDPAGAGGSTVATVVAFPVEPERRYTQSRYVRSIRTKEDGTFTIDVPPGQYWVAAVGGAALPAFPADTLQQLERFSTSVFAGDAGGRVELRVVPMPR